MVTGTWLQIMFVERVDEGRYVWVGEYLKGALRE